MLFQIPQRYRFSSKSQLTCFLRDYTKGCFRYHKGTDFQANHNSLVWYLLYGCVVLDTTKVQIFKQITTYIYPFNQGYMLFQIPQRYRFSSKSQHLFNLIDRINCCFRYHKGTDFQANHNGNSRPRVPKRLFQIPQRYRFSSKSQRDYIIEVLEKSCFRYHKGTDFQANHNLNSGSLNGGVVVLDTTKVQIFKQITTDYISKFK